MNDRVSMQIHLDQSSGKAAIHLRACLITLEDSKQRIQKAKASLTLACTMSPLQCPTIKAFVDSMIRFEEHVQKLARVRWSFEKTRLQSINPLPELDEIEQAGSAEILLKQNGLYSGAKVHKTKSNPFRNPKYEWNIAWTK